MAGSAYSVNLIYPTSQVKVIKGTLKDCKRIADSGNTVVSFFWCARRMHRGWKDTDQDIVETAGQHCGVSRLVEK
jgi:hypothetical protein